MVWGGFAAVEPLNSGIDSSCVNEYSTNGDNIAEESKRSSHWRCSVRKGVLRNFAKFTGKHLCESLFLNKVAGLRPATLLKETLAQVFFYKFCEISKNTFFRAHLGATASEVIPIQAVAAVDSSGSGTNNINRFNQECNFPIQ